MITLGADPEWFILRKRTSYGLDVVPCVGLIPGTKAEPHDIGHGFGVHEDNVVVELTVPVTTTPQDFGDGLIQGKKLLLRRHLRDLEANLQYSAGYTFHSDQLDSKQAQEFGCEPDFDAYTSGGIRHTPTRMMRGCTRYAGGHVHLGGDFNCPPFVAALFCDLFISIPERWARHDVAWPNEYQGFSERVQWYGAPGIFRPKEYGIEYRTPTNLWTSTLGSATGMGDRMWRCAHWLESTPALEIRTALKNIDWIKIKEVLTSTDTDRETVGEKCSSILTQSAQWCPV